nr:MAG TPA: hypothetical protein [Bacteriophage sp.]
MRLVNLITSWRTMVIFTNGLSTIYLVVYNI